VFVILVILVLLDLSDSNKLTKTNKISCLERCDKQKKVCAFLCLDQKTHESIAQGSIKKMRVCASSEQKIFILKILGCQVFSTSKYYRRNPKKNPQYRTYFSGPKTVSTLSRLVPAMVQFGPKEGAKKIFNGRFKVLLKSLLCQDHE